MSKNRNKQNKGNTVSDNNDNTTIDLSNDLGSLGDMLKAAGTVGVLGPDDHGVGVEPGEESPEGIETVTPEVTPVAEAVTAAVSPVANVLESAAVAAAVVVEEIAPVTDFETPVKVDMPALGDTSRVRTQKAIFDTYVDVVAPGKPINWEVMTNHHIRMCKALLESAGYPYIEFKEVYDYLLKLVKEHRAKAFSDIYVRRFDDRLYPKMTKDQIMVADRLLSIITTVGRHNDRGRAVQQIDLALSLKAVKPAVAQQNLSAYFGAFRR